MGMARHTMSLPTIRPRRLRQNSALRDLLAEHHLSVSSLIYPLFIKEGTGILEPLPGIAKQKLFSLDRLDPEIDTICALGLPAVLLFGIPNKKDNRGELACLPTAVIPQAIRAIKLKAPHLLVISDLCFCEYTTHGHCGVLDATGTTVENDATLAMLLKQALVHAQAGVDVLAPSGMVDGMVGYLRSGLDQAGYSNVLILSYAVKYASAFYGPFRSAVASPANFGDRKTYQMNPANVASALREAALDVDQAVDMLMVKPAHTYLDIIYRIKQQHPHTPLGAYHVSGEYAMILAAAKQGAINERDAMLESLLSIKRAGADFIISYAAKDVARWLS